MPAKKTAKAKSSTRANANTTRRASGAKAKTSAKKKTKRKTKAAKEKEVKISILSAGISKKITLRPIEETTPFGTYQLFDATEYTEVPKAEFLRLAEELDVAILAPFGKIFPPGKTARDMINQQTAQKAKKGKK